MLRRVTGEHVCQPRLAQRERALVEFELATPLSLENRELIVGNEALRIARFSGRKTASIKDTALARRMLSCF